MSGFVRIAVFAVHAHPNASGALKASVESIGVEVQSLLNVCRVPFAQERDSWSGCGSHRCRFVHNTHLAHP